MSQFTRPTITEIRDRVIADLETEVVGINARLRRRVERGIAYAMAGASHLMHGHIAWVAEQILPDEAAERFLERWAAFFDVFRKAATVATGSITVTGTGGTVPAGTQYVRTADGATFTVNAEVTGINPSAPVTVTADTAGAAGNMVAGETMRLVSPIVGIVSEATVTASGLIGGTDIETTDALLVRLLERIRRPPMGGAPGDYVTWMKLEPGVTRAWEYKGTDGSGNPGLGKVSVAFVRDVDGEPDFPDTAEVAAMQVTLTALAPAEVIAFEIGETPLALAITLTPNTAAVQAAVIAEIKDMLLRDAAPGATIYLSRIREAISTATGETSHVLTSPVADVTHAFGAMATYTPPSFS